VEIARSIYQRIGCPSLNAVVMASSLLAFACSQPVSVGVKEQPSAKGDPMTKPTETKTDMAILIVSNKLQMAQFDGQVVVAKGRYVTQDLGRHKVTTVAADGTTLKSNIAVSVALADGEYLFVGARPEQERKDFDEKQVEVRAKLVVSPAKIGADASGNVPQQMDPVPTLMDVVSVQIAP
jgi:hypothetical protein